ncbi:MAG: hypothetical protein IAE94_10180 [Chthoniobacterales bacterium]|nr:hypothetical protein [Chthoniobacterales bacterium]
MKQPSLIFHLIFFAACGVGVAAPVADPRIPEPLRVWEGWALWGQDHRTCPTPYDAADKPLCLWPSRLVLDVAPTGARFDFSVTVFNESWVPLPGGGDFWPHQVKAGAAALPVVERNGHPAVKLTAGTHQIQGELEWKTIPQKISLPDSLGMVSLTLEGKPVENPHWDSDGQLWLVQSAVSGEADKDFLSVKLFAELEDGIPLWLHGEVELIVSGKNREESLGAVLPEGWKLVALEGPIPVAVDESGRMKAQVRPGKWTVKYTAFRLDNPKEFQFASSQKPVAPEALIAFRSRPDFRLVEILGSPSVDVSQIAFPEQWRALPVFRWDTATPFRMEERMRGMGFQKPAGLDISREWWLDENGKAFTFRDRLTGGKQEIWRLDVTRGQDLGSVRSQGAGQLITRNPLTGAPGVEIRSRTLNLEANGRMERAGTLSASGWQTDADSLRVTLNLPPGWRLFALFGSDWVNGDWLTAWSLLDLFLLLIFSLAVGKLWGWRLAALAFVAFGLAYHEPGAPRFVWLGLLIPLALLRVVHKGWGQRILLAAKWLVIAAFVFLVVPFASRQIQQAIYPQLERPSHPVTLGDFESAPASEPVREAMNAEAEAVPKTLKQRTMVSAAASAPQQYKSNLTYDTKARIQTGPGVPDWSWQNVSFGWNGPVAASQVIRPVMISIGMGRVLSVLRVVLVLGLAGLLLRGARSPRVAAGVPIALALAFLPSANAQMPDEKMLNTLRDRLTETSDAYPNAAAISRTTLRLAGNRLEMDVEIQAAIPVAVPLPGRLPAWSPVSVQLDGKPASALRRDGGFLWIPVPQGVHQVRVTGLLPEVAEWEWMFLLKPRSVVIDAPEWTVNGVSATGVPDQQVLFTKNVKTTPGEATYDRQDFSTLASVERRIELGLVWQVRTTVRRLSPGGKAIALRIPLLEGENVLTSNAQIKEGAIEVRLGAQQESTQWESELTPSAMLSLGTTVEDSWVEIWRLVASPVWNVSLTGLPPVFEPRNPDLVPVWHPWPGEGVKLAISRPEAIPGATVTVEKVTHKVTPGMRQRTSVLDLVLRCSLGEDFSITLPTDAEVSGLKVNGATIPARMDSRQLIVSLRPGEQAVQVEWKINLPMGMRSQVEEVKLPVDSANINTVLNMPESRWVLWTGGPLRGPAVRFWTVLACSLVAAWLLGRLPSSPLSTVEWMLLGIGLTQVPLPAALLVVGWLFALSWRGSESCIRLPNLAFNLLQIALIGLTVIALGVFVAVVAEGLLGNPEMFILGNDSTPSALKWYQARSADLLPQPGCVSVSIWWFRLLMLVWALWLSASLLRWLRLAWVRFSTGGCFRGGTKKSPVAPPPLS